MSTYRSPLSPQQQMEVGRARLQLKLAKNPTARMRALRKLTELGVGPKSFAPKTA
jgi:hypothetical protein